MSGHGLFPDNCPFAWGIWAPSNVCFFGPTRVHNPNGISIGSAVLAGLTTVTDRQTVGHVRACSSPLKLPLSMGICTPSNTWLFGSTCNDSASQMASSSVQPLFHSSPQKVPILNNGRTFPRILLSLSMWDLDRHLIHGFLAHSSSQPKWRLDRFSRFCRAQYCDTLTNTLLVLVW